MTDTAAALQAALEEYEHYKEDTKDTVGGYASGREAATYYANAVLAAYAAHVKALEDESRAKEVGANCGRIYARDGIPRCHCDDRICTLTEPCRFIDAEHPSGRWELRHE